MQADEGLPAAPWFAEMAHGSGLIFFALRVQPDVAYEYVSEAIADKLGVTAAEALADADNVHSRTDPDYLDNLVRAIATPPGEQTHVELKWRHRDGSFVHSRCWAQARQRADGSVVLEGTVAAITELRDVESELRRSEQRLRLLVENAYDVIWTMAMDGTVTHVNPAVMRVRGITPEEARHQSSEEINPPESAARVGEYYQRVFAAIEAGTEPPAFLGEMEYYRKDGSIMTGELQVIPHVDGDGQVVELIGVTRDISDRKVLENELTRLAATDPVTGVWNRHHGRALLVTETAQGDGPVKPLSILMVDIDNFKAINDSFGHPAGDAVLVEVARRLSESVRSSDMVARWGGEEFVVLLRDCTLDDAVERAEEIRRQIAERTFPGVGTVTVSVGAAQLTVDEDVASLLGRADEALYEAKRAGRNKVVARGR